MVNLKKAAAIVVIFSLVFCSCGKKIPNMVQRDNNDYSDYGNASLNNNPKNAKEVERNRRILHSFTNPGKDKKNNDDEKNNDPNPVRTDVEYDENGRRKNCTLEGNDICCLKNYGFTEEEFCKKKDGSTSINGIKMFKKCSLRLHPDKNECVKNGECTIQEAATDYVEMSSEREGMCPS